MTCRERRPAVKPVFTTKPIRGRGGRNGVCHASRPDAGYQFQFRTTPTRPWTYVYCGVTYRGKKYTDKTVRDQLRSMCRRPGVLPQAGQYRFILCTWRRKFDETGRKGWRPVIEHATAPVELTFE